MSDTFLLLGGGVKVLGRLKHGSFLQSEQVRRVSEIEGEKESARWKLTVFCKLIFEVTPHHFCLILFVRSKSLNQVTHNQKRLHRASCKGMGITGSPCRSSPPQSSLISLITIFQFSEMLKKKKAAFTFIHILSSTCCYAHLVNLKFQILQFCILKLSLVLFLGFYFSSKISHVFMHYDHFFLLIP